MTKIVSQPTTTTGTKKLPIPILNLPSIYRFRDRKLTTKNSKGCDVFGVIAEGNIQTMSTVCFNRLVT